MTKTQEIMVIEKELNPMLLKAKDLNIRGLKDMEVATEYLSQLNLAKDRVTERMETITVPAKETIKAAESIWKPFINMAKDAIQLIRDKQSAYQTEQVRIVREKEAKVAARVASGNIKLDTGVRKMGEIEKPVEEIYTDSGNVKFREDKCFEVVDVSKLPVKYVVPNEVAIRIAMKAGIKIPGVRYFTKMVPVNKR